MSKKRALGRGLSALLENSNTDITTKNIGMSGQTVGSISSLSIKRPVLAIVMNLLIILFGVIAYRSLGVREFPSIDPPVVTVRANYPGANADIIESQITVPLEKALNGIEGIRTISSASNQGSCNITIECELGSDME